MEQIFDQNQNIWLEYWHSNDNNKYSKQNLILAHKITYEMIVLRFFRLKWRKKALNPPLWILVVPRVLCVGVFFLVYPEGIRNICAKF